MKTKILKIAVIVLFIADLTILYLGYNKFFNKDGQTELDFHNFMQVLNIKNYQDASLLLNIIDLKEYFSRQKNIRVGDDKIQITSDADTWFGFDSNPIVLNCPFRILLNFSGQNDYTALVISGKINTPEKEWWQNINRLYIAYNQKYQSSVLELRDGNSPHSKSFPFKNNINGSSLILEFSDHQGKQLSVYDTKGTLLAKINIAKLKDKHFPAGLFPNNKMYVGVLLAPNSKLVVNKLFYYPKCKQ